MSRNLLLASYPKSGNTWLRIFLANFCSDGPDPVDINALDDMRPSSLVVFEEAIGVEPTAFSDEEIDLFRPEVYRYLARTGKTKSFLKVHDSFRMNSAGEPVIPADAVEGAVYIVRNPLDVAISLAHHEGESVDYVIDTIMARYYSPRRRFLFGQIRQHFFPWGQHVLSWVDQTAIPVHVVRYEDMLARPDEVFAGIIGFCGIPPDTTRISCAIEKSSFERVRQQEINRGFREKSPDARAFFRQGKAGTWRDVLSQSQVERVVSSHGAVMERFGYLP
jgi:hypothetical protein